VVVRGSPQGSPPGERPSAGAGAAGVFALFVGCPGRARFEAGWKELGATDGCEADAATVCWLVVWPPMLLGAAPAGRCAVAGVVTFCLTGALAFCLAGR